jgi:hypothetical protein
MRQGGQGARLPTRDVEIASSPLIGYLGPAPIGLIFGLKVGEHLNCAHRLHDIHVVAVRSYPIGTAKASFLRRSGETESPVGVIDDPRSTQGGTPGGSRSHDHCGSGSFLACLRSYAGGLAATRWWPQFPKNGAAGAISHRRSHRVRRSGHPFEHGSPGASRMKLVDNSPSSFASNMLPRRTRTIAPRQGRGKLCIFFREIVVPPR